jgi:hypothetical protein
MTEPTELSRTLFDLAIGAYCELSVDKEKTVIAMIDNAIAAARAEERAEFERLAQSDEMVEKLRHAASVEVYYEESLSADAVRAVLAALFRETEVQSSD